jgi:hypothetical protein
MIPMTLTSTEAQRLLDLGRAWLHGPEALITRRARYAWDAVTQRYTRTEPDTLDAPDVPASPPPWAAGAPGPVPGLERVAHFFERLDPQRHPPIGQPRLGLSRLAMVCGIVGLLLFVDGYLRASASIENLPPLTKVVMLTEAYGALAIAGTPAQQARAQQDMQLLAAGKIPPLSLDIQRVYLTWLLDALPSWGWIGLWLLLGGAVVQLGTSRHSVLARWLWAQRP